MNLPLVNEVIEAVLYEGYILYPYRPTAKKNRQRFTFGRVYPHDYSVAQNGAEPFVMGTQCLLTGRDRTHLELSVRFLHVTSREILSFREPQPELPASLSAASVELVPELRVDGQSFLTWQEAVEREVNVGPQTIKQMAGTKCQVPFQFPAEEQLELIKDRHGSIVGLIRRRKEQLDGEILCEIEEIEAGLFRIAVEIVNRTPVPETELENQDAVLLRTLASTHTVLHTDEGQFVSLMDPPDSRRELAAACKNQGTWPVLVGDESAADRTTMLSFDEDIFGDDRRLEEAELNGVVLRPGDRVKIRPRSRADIMDIALAGKIAAIEAIEQDAEGRIHFALVLDDDPGKDLGYMRQPGHRFFYTIDEVELVSEAR
jgi:hydrogenase maturation protease